MRGLFITFEGIEGCGKTTQSARLVERLRREGCSVVAIREPGGTGVGEAIRKVLKHDPAGELLVSEAETLLFSASRAQLVRNTILPTLERGDIVVCDRFFDSTTAYQGYGRGMDLDAILGINRFAADGAVPDITILLDVEVEEGFRRLEARHAANNTGRDRIERESAAFHARVRGGYLELAAQSPDRFRIVKSDDVEDGVARRVWAAVKPVLVGRGLSYDS